MKKILLVTILILAISANAKSWAQGFYLGPKAGVNLSTLSSLSNSTPLVKGELGLLMGYQVGGALAIQVEALYSWQGSRTEKFGNQIDLSLDYIKVPVIAKIFLIRGLNIEAGVSFNFLTAAHAKYNGAKDKIDDLSGFDFSIPVGLSYVIANKVDISLRYDISLVNVKLPESGTAKNSNFALSVAYRF